MQNDNTVYLAHHNPHVTVDAYHQTNTRKPTWHMMHGNTLSGPVFLAISSCWMTCLNCTSVKYYSLYDVLLSARWITTSLYREGKKLCEVFPRWCTGHRGYRMATMVPWHHKKVKCTPVQALRLCTGRTAHRGSRGIALTIHDHSTRRGRWVSVTARPLFTSGKDLVPLYSRLGGPLGRSGQVRKISPTPGFDAGPSSP